MKLLEHHLQGLLYTVKKTAESCDAQGWCNFNIYTGHVFLGASTESSVSNFFVTFLFYKISVNCKKHLAAGGPRILNLSSNLPFHVHADFEGSSKTLIFLKNVFFLAVCCKKSPII